MRSVALLVIGGAGTFLCSALLQHDTLPTRADRAPQPATAELGLLAERSGTDLLLSWNHGAPAIANATLGRMTIKTSSVTRQITLTPSQLRSGRVLYSPTPVADQIDIRLEVDARSPGQTISEGIVVILPPPTADEPQLSVSASRAPPAIDPAVRDRDEDLRIETRGPEQNVASTLRLRSKDSIVVLARELSSAAELRQNPDNLVKLVQSGLLFTVTRGTAAALQQMEGGFIKVRILDGAHAGQEGWIDRSQASSK